MATESRIKEIIANQLAVEEKDLALNETLEKHLKGDDAAFNQLILALEQEFDITIPEEDAKNLAIVQEVVNYVQIRAK